MTLKRTRRFFAKSRLRREIAVVLALKLVLLLTLLFVFFGPSTKLNPTAQTAAAHLIGPGNR